MFLLHSYSVRNPCSPGLLQFDVKTAKILVNDNQSQIQYRRLWTSTANGSNWRMAVDGGLVDCGSGSGSWRSANFLSVADCCTAGSDAVK